MALNKFFFYKKNLRIFFLTLIGIFLCTGYMTGSDWRSYEQWFYDRDIWSNYYKEPGLILLMEVFKALGIGFWPMWILIKAVCYYFTISSFYYFSKGHYSWGFFFFIGYFALFYYIDNPMRNLIAATIFFKFAIPNIERKNLILYIVAVVVSCFFHLSSLLVFPFYFVSRRKIIPVKRAILIFTFLIGLILLFGNSPILDSINSFFGDVDLYQNRLMRYVTEKVSYGLSLGLLFQVILFFVALLRNKQYLFKNENVPLIINLSFLYVIFLLLGSLITILFRISMFLFVPYLICLCIWLKNEKIKDYVIVTKMVVFVFLLYIYYHSITRDYRYLPYSSYLEYVFKKKPSFEYRSSYNFINSPYNKEPETDEDNRKVR